MFSGLLVAALLASIHTEPQVELAFTAEYYVVGKPGGHSHVYLSDLHGKHRRQITFGNDDEGEVAWLGRDKLLFLARHRHGAPSPYYRSWSELQCYDLRTGRTTTLRRRPNMVWLRARPDVGRGKPYLSFGDKLYRVTSGGLVRAPDTVYHVASFLADNEVVLWCPRSGQPVWLTLIEFEDQPWRVERCGHTYAIPGRGWCVDLTWFEDPDPRYAWLWTYCDVGTVANYETMMRVDWATGEVQTPTDIDDRLDFDVREPLWSARDGEKGESELPDGRRVSLGGLVVGDMSTGARWMLETDLACVSSTGIRPFMQSAAGNNRGLGDLPNIERVAADPMEWTGLVGWEARSLRARFERWSQPSGY